MAALASGMPSILKAHALSTQMKSSSSLAEAGFRVAGFKALSSFGG